MSVVDELLCAGGDPIDKRSSRASVPAFGAWLVPNVAKQLQKISIFAIEYTWEK